MPAMLRSGRRHGASAQIVRRYRAQKEEVGITQQDRSRAEPSKSTNLVEDAITLALHLQSPWRERNQLNLEGFQRAWRQTQAEWSIGRNGEVKTCFRKGFARNDRCHHAAER